MLFGQRIKEERIKRGLSQQELGDLLHVSKVSVCGYEKGTRTPSLETFNKLIEILEITPDYALGNDVSVVCEENPAYSTKLSKEDIIIIRELKKNPKLYQKFCEDPKRVIDVITRKIKF